MIFLSQDKYGSGNVWSLFPGVSRAFFRRFQDRFRALLYIDRLIIGGFWCVYPRGESSEVGQDLLCVNVLFSTISYNQGSRTLRSNSLLFRTKRGSSVAKTVATTANRGKQLGFSRIKVTIIGGKTSSMLRTAAGNKIQLATLPRFLTQSTGVNKHPAIITVQLGSATKISRTIEQTQDRLKLPCSCSFQPSGKGFCYDRLI